MGVCAKKARESSNLSLPQFLTSAPSRTSSSKPPASYRLFVPFAPLVCGVLTVPPSCLAGFSSLVLGVPTAFWVRSSDALVLSRSRVVSRWGALFPCARRGSGKTRPIDRAQFVVRWDDQHGLHSAWSLSRSACRRSSSAQCSPSPGAPGPGQLLQEQSLAELP